MLSTAGRLRIFAQVAAALSGSSCWISTPPSPLVTSERACVSQPFSAGGHHSAGSTPAGATVVSSDSRHARRVGRMEVRVLVFRQVLLRHRADAETGDALALGLGVVDLDDHHVAAVALAPLDVAAGRGALLERRDDLEEIVAGRADDIDQPPLGDAGVAIGDLEPKDVAQLLAGAFEVLDDEDALPELHRFLPFLVRRVYRNAMRTVWTMGFVAAAALSFCFPDFIVFRFTQAAIWAMALLGLVLLCGVSGQFSFAQAGLFGIGGYAAAILGSHTALLGLLRAAAGAAGGLRRGLRAGPCRRPARACGPRR